MYSYSKVKEIITKCQIKSKNKTNIKTINWSNITQYNI